MREFKKSEFGEATKGTVFIFGGWRMSSIFYRQGIYKMNKLGYKCVLYLPHSSLLKIGTQHSAIVEASDDALSLVKTYIKNDHAPNAKYMIMGTSLGTVFATRIAKENKNIKALMLMAPFGDFDKHMDQWVNHRYFGKLARSQQTSIAESVAILNQINTANDLTALNGKHVLVCYGSNDKIIHSNIIEEFIAKLHANNIDVITKQVPGGHMSSMYKTSMWFKPEKLPFFK